MGIVLALAILKTVGFHCTPVSNRDWTVAFTEPWLCSQLLVKQSSSMIFALDGYLYIFLPLAYSGGRLCLFQTTSMIYKRKAHISWFIVTCEGSTRYWNYLKDHWPCAGGLSAVNAIGTQLGDSINSGLTRWRMAV